MRDLKLYIHIGTHKTGSTAIQSAIRQNTIFLRKEGIIFLPFFREFEPLMMVDKTIDNQIIYKCRSALLRKINSLNQNKHNQRFLLSWEGFSGNPLIGYQNSGMVARHLRKITEGLNVKLIVYLRRQDEFVESMYTQKIHEGFSYTFEEFIENYPFESLDWNRFLSSYSEYFGNNSLIVKRYDKAFLPMKNSLLIDFAKIIGVKNGSLAVMTPTSNKGYSRDALEIAKCANLYLNSEEKIKFRKILQQTNTKQPFEKYTFWEHHKRKKLISNYDESNSIVLREYFNETIGELFPYQSLIEDNKIYEEISLETTIRTLVKIILTIEKQNKTTVVKIKEKAVVLLRRFPKIKSVLSEYIFKYRLW